MLHTMYALVVYLLCAGAERPLYTLMHYPRYWGMVYVHSAVRMALFRGGDRYRRKNGLLIIRHQRRALRDPFFSLNFP